MKFQTRLKRMQACADAIEWCEQFKTFDKAWQKCERGDWMLWLIGKRIKTLKERKKLVLCVCQCARLSLKYIPKDEKRPLIAIETAENWAQDKGKTLGEVKDAAYAAYAAFAAAYAAYADAAYAAYAAFAAAYAADAAYAAAYAAYAAAYAAAAAAFAAAAAAFAARGITLKKCADIVRKFYPDYKFKEETNDVSLCKTTGDLG